MTNTISTARGNKSPNDALSWLKHPDCSVPHKTTILRSLAELAPFFGHEAAGWIRKQPYLKSENKLQRVAEEVLTGLPLGEKRFTEEAAFLKYLKTLPQGSHVQITIGKDKIRQLPQLLSLNGKYLAFSSNSVMFLHECVVSSGRWESISRTHSVQIFTTTGASVEVLAKAISLCVESIELSYTLQQLQQLLEGRTLVSQKLVELLLEYQDVMYDGELFIQTVEGLQYFEAKAWLRDFGSLEVMENVLNCFHSDYGRLEFFKAYALNFRMLMAS